MVDTVDTIDTVDTVEPPCDIPRIALRSLYRFKGLQCENAQPSCHGLASCHLAEK